MASRLSKRVPRMLVIAVALMLGIGVTVALSDDNPQPIDFTHNVADAPSPVAGTVFLAKAL